MEPESNYKNFAVSVSPQTAANTDKLKMYLAKKMHVSPDEISHVLIVRRSVDARKPDIKINLSVNVYFGNETPADESLSFAYQNVALQPEVVIVGAGPAGLFAALRLIELNVKPVIVERGKDVSSRKIDIAAIHRNLGVDPDSNYGFGEGGAGTFSDGKLYTRSKKRGNVRKVLEVFRYHGAQPDILIDAHPHIGTNVLPGVIKNMRKTILDSGGEIHFSQRVNGFIVKNAILTGVKTHTGQTFEGKAVVLATGHSARDIYRLLNAQKILVEAKNFAVGLRVEHPQSLIDSIQYHGNTRGQYLPPASYSFVEQVKGRGVYSFCMCPGGVVVPAATQSNQVVVNGMSPSHRGGVFANSGIVCEVRTDDISDYAKYGELAGMEFQRELEEKCSQIVGKSQIAPAQRLVDFVKSKHTADLSSASTSYKPGIESYDLHSILPPFIARSLQQGFVQINKKAQGFISREAILLGVESRTSSPVRIPRNGDTFEHITTRGLYPCGEGAGYAGGIVSSAVDGELCAEKVAAAL